MGADRDGSAAQAVEALQVAAAVVGPAARAEAEVAAEALVAVADRQSSQEICACGSGALEGRVGCWRDAAKEKLLLWHRLQLARR